MFVSGTDDDLEYYVRECGDILGVTTNLAQDKRDAKHIIEHIFTQVVEFKKLNQVRASKNIQCMCIYVCIYPSGFVPIRTSVFMDGFQMIWVIVHLNEQKCHMHFAFT